MEKSLKFILFIILAVSLVSIYFTITGHSGLRSISKDLQRANRSADSALNELKIAKIEIDSLHAGISTLQSYVTYVQKSVTLNDARKQKEEAKTAAEIKAAQEKINILTKDFRTDSLPPTDERPLKVKP